MTISSYNKRKMMVLCYKNWLIKNHLFSYSRQPIYLNIKGNGNPDPFSRKE